MSKTKRVIRPERVNSQGECTIYILYTHRSKNTYISTHEQVKVKDWDSKSGSVKKSHRGYRGLNNFIEEIQAEIDEIKRDLIREKIDPDVQTLKTRYKEKNEPEHVVSKDFFPSLDDFIVYKEEIEKNEKSTIKQYRSFQNHLKAFEKYWRRKLSFPVISAKFYTDYLDYLFHEVEMSDNSAGAQVKQLKAFLRWSIHEKRSSNMEFSNFKKPSSETNIIALTEDEFNRFYQHEFTNKRLQKVKDAFIFSCTTGLRFSDYARIDKDSIVGNQIIIHAKKTGQEIRIPLYDYSRTILERYDYKLDVISNQKTNEYLKVAAKEAGLGNIRDIKYTKGRETAIERKPLYEIISSHMGRKTFVTMMLNKGYPPKDIMAITGHKSLSSFQRYIAISEQRISQQMSEAWSLNEV